MREVFTDGVAEVAERPLIGGKLRDQLAQQRRGALWERVGLCTAQEDDLHAPNVLPSAS